MSYTLRIKDSAERALSRLPKAQRRRIDEEILSLCENPRPSGAIPLKGSGKGLWRVRVGDWRIVYQIRDVELVVLVIMVAHRREVYRGL
jgi:mRNA interferase RelE/StbE